MRWRFFIVGWAAVLGLSPAAYGADGLRYVGAGAERGASRAVIVGDVPLAHAAQLLPLDNQGRIVGEGDVAAQAEQVLSNLATSLAAAGSSLDQLVKLNVYATDQEAAEVVGQLLAKRFADDRKPAVSFVTTKLPHQAARVAMDAVGVRGGEAGRSVQAFRSEKLYPMHCAQASSMPAGTRIYVAGQAEKAETLADATRKTLESLRSTLRFLGRRDTDIVQLKVFFSPMSEVSAVHSELSSFFGRDAVPPLVCVEWKASLIEIELIAWGGDHNAGPVVEYLTPPGMSSSPLFSRVARINSSPSIYTSGLVAREATSAAVEVKDIFEQLRGVLTETGSDFQHLVKATYYCSTDAASQKLNELRPNYYDPSRPPSASKAMVAGVARAQRGFTLDMIAVPAWDDSTAEYGPAEQGHKLSAEQARAGWLSLFDGQSTFGWRDSKTDEQGLFGGESTTAFGPCLAQIEVSQAGSLTKGDQTFELTGTHQLMLPDSVDFLHLNATVRVKRLHVQPLGLRPILSGGDLAGWQRIDHKSLAEDKRPKWSVANKTLHAQGGPGAMEYSARPFADFLLQVEAKTTARHANGGIFFRSIPGDFMNGYEAQIYNRALDGDPSRPARYSTGALDDRQMARQLVSRDGESFKMTIIAQGPHIATWVNGAQMTDWTDTREPQDNPREGRRTAAGTIQLQAHDPGTELEFVEIRIAEVGVGGK